MSRSLMKMMRTWNCKLKQGSEETRREKQTKVSRKIKRLRWDPFEAPSYVSSFPAPMLVSGQSQVVEEPVSIVENGDIGKNHSSLTSSQYKPVPKESWVQHPSFHNIWHFDVIKCKITMTVIAYCYGANLNMFFCICNMNLYMLIQIWLHDG